MALLGGLSQTDKALNDTLIRKAETDHFDDLMRMHGLPRISGIPIKYWRRAALRAAYGRRYSLYTIFWFLREALQGADVQYAVKVDSAPLKAGRIYWVSGGGGAGFHKEDLGRFWLVDGKVYWSIDGDGVWAGGVSTFLQLSPYAGPLWGACAWTTPAGQWTNKGATLLPFVCRGFGGVLEVLIQQIDGIPPTFLKGGWQWEYKVLANGVAQTTGTYTAESANVVTDLAIVDITSSDEGLVPARADVCTATLWVNGAPSTLTCILGVADVSKMDSAHTVTIQAGDVLQVKLLPGGALASPIKARLSVTAKAQTNEPLGGNLMPSAIAPQGHPIYLAGEADAEWTDLLSRFVALGVVVRVKRLPTVGGK